MTRSLPLVLLAVVFACSGGETETAPAPEPAVPAATPEEQAREIAGDPRMLLFDLETALEGVHEASGSWPTTAEFEVDDRWEFQRAALDAAFSSWEYVSDGATYRLTGVTENRRFEIASPSS